MDKLGGNQDTRDECESKSGGDSRHPRNRCTVGVGLVAFNEGNQ